jgi:CARDB protein
MKRTIFITLIIIISLILTVNITIPIVNANDSTKPDLQVLELKFKNPGINNLKAGEKTTLCVLVLDGGNETLEDLWTIIVKRNSKEISNESITQNIEPGSIFWHNFTTSFPEHAGDYEYTVIVDTEDKIDEINEDDNYLMTGIRVASPRINYSFAILFVSLIIINLVIISYVIYKVRKEKKYMEINDIDTENVP